MCWPSFLHANRHISRSSPCHGARHLLTEFYIVTVDFLTPLCTVAARRQRDLRALQLVEGLAQELSPDWMTPAHAGCLGLSACSLLNAHIPQAPRVGRPRTSDHVSLGRRRPCQPTSGLGLQISSGVAASGPCTSSPPPSPPSSRPPPPPYIHAEHIHTETSVGTEVVDLPRPISADNNVTMDGPGYQQSMT